jgi:hypothetical protein
VKGKLPIVLSATALVIAVLGTTTPAIAHGVRHALFAHNADKVDGRHANQLVRATTVRDTSSVNDFDSGGYTPLLTKSVNAPSKGILLVWGTISAARDVSDPDEGILNARITIGTESTTDQSVNLENGGSSDGSIAISGAIPVTKGPKSVVLEARELSAGMAFIVNKSITTLFVPFGNTGQVGALGRVMTQSAAARPSND